MPCLPWTHIQVLLIFWVFLYSYWSVSNTSTAVPIFMQSRWLLFVPQLSPANNMRHSCYKENTKMGHLSISIQKGFFETNVGSRAFFTHWLFPGVLKLDPSFGGYNISPLNFQCHFHGVVTDVYFVNYDSLGLFSCISSRFWTYQKIPRVS